MPWIGMLEHHPVVKAKQGHIEARCRHHRRRLCRIGWQIRVNRMIAKYAHDRRVVKPSTTRFK